MSFHSNLHIFHLGLFAGLATASLAATAPKTVGNLNSTPIYFEPNQGQFDPAVRFLARGAKYQAWITDSALVLELSKGQAPVKIQFGPQQQGAKRQIEGLEKQPGTSSYFHGSDSRKWITGVPSYSKARLAEVYPGIDVVFYGRNDTREIEYDFVVKPGADPSQISIDFDPKLKPRQGISGEVTMDLPGGKLRHEIPSVHLLRGGKRVDYTARFDGRRLRFQFGQYDSQETLVVDPSVVWSTYISGFLESGATGVALDPQGNTYVTGTANTANFPLANFADSAGAVTNAIYVVKIGASPGAGGLYPRLYSAYFGNGSASGIAVDSTGAAYITGDSGPGFPIRNAFQSNYGGGGDAFVTKISAAPGNAGHTIVYSSYIGGIREEDGSAIAVDATGAAYVTGRTWTFDGFPTLNNGVPPPGPFNGPVGWSHSDVFVVKVAAAPSNNGVYERVYSVLYGGGYIDSAGGIAVDSAGAAYITGSTISQNIPLVQAFGTLAASSNAFVAKIGGAPVSGLYQLVYSTYLGGSGDDSGTGIAVDSTGTAYVTGRTGSPDFPTRLPLQNALRGGSDAFVTSIAGSAPYVIQFSTYWGGDDFDYATSIALSGPGKAHIAGLTQSGRVFSDFPIIDPAILPGTFAQHAFTARFSIDATAARPEYSTHLDRSAGALATSIAVDAAGSAVVVGYTRAADFLVLNGIGAQVPAPTPTAALDASAFGFAMRLGATAGSGTVLIASNATGRRFTTAGTGCNPGQYTAPQVFAWPTGTSCTVTFDEVFESTDTRYTFKNWSDNNSTNRVRTIVSDGALRLFTAVYDEAYALTVTAYASGTTTVLPGLVTPATKVFHPAGTVVTVTALSNSTWSFAFWSGYVARVTAAVTTVKMDGPRDIWALFEPVPAQRGTALQFVPIAPCRIADTRAGNGATPIAALSTRNFPVAGTCNIPASAQAYALNVTVVPRGQLGYLTLWPTGKPQPVVSTLNSLDGRVKANAAVVPAGTNGSVSAFVTDTTDVVIDINGFFQPPGALTLQYFPVTPCRIIDTRKFARPGPGLPGGTAITIPVQGETCGIPSTARAYVLNAAVVPTNTLGFLTLWPTGSARPLASTLNATTGTVVANAAIINGGTGGSIDAFATDNTELILDITGYFAPASSSPGGLNFYAVDPCRLWDSRPFAPLNNGQDTTMGINVTPGCTLPDTARVASLNVTVIPSPSLGYLTMWSLGEPQPAVSTLNALDGAITSNAAMVGVSARGFKLFGNGTTHFVLDVNGYFATY
jgi:hypothetical protein